MGVLHRIRFYIGMAIRDGLSSIYEKACVITGKEIMTEFEASPKSLSSEEKTRAERTIRACEENKPILDPVKTMLIHSRPEEHRCNIFSANSYRHKLLAAIELARRNGIDTFLLDYYTPFGLLALEELVKLRAREDAFRVYAVRSTSLRNRRTYRVIRETPIEMIVLPGCADYIYHEMPEYVIRYILPMAGVRFSENGFWYSRDLLPPEKLKMWEADEQINSYVDLK